MENITTDQLAGMIKEQFDEVNGRLGKIKSNMLTKDYLDEKLADLRGDLVVLTRN